MWASHMLLYTTDLLERTHGNFSFKIPALTNNHSRKVSIIELLELSVLFDRMLLG